MSTCISQHGEYSSHEPNADYVCTLCGVLDEEALITELNAARTQVAELTTDRDRLQKEQANLELALKSMMRGYDSLITERDAARKDALLAAARSLLAEAEAHDKKWCRQPRKPNTADWDMGYVAGMKRSAHDLANSIDRPAAAPVPDVANDRAAAAEAELERQVIEAARHLASHGPLGLLSGIDPAVWAVERDSRWAALRVALAAVDALGSAVPTDAVCKCPGDCGHSEATS